METTDRLGGSFRDPSGFVFKSKGELYRQVNLQFQAEYEAFMASGLYDKLVARRLLIAHTEVTSKGSTAEAAYKILKPERIPFVSYPYEWCFSQLSSAAMLTLDIALLGLEHGMILRDASAYNVQFKGVRPVFIDTLSFEPYREGKPWAAYQQFCRHFLAPLAIMAHSDVRLATLLRTNIDGIPLNLAASLLPWKTKLQPSLLTHLHLHAKSQARYSERVVKRSARFSKRALIGLLQSLQSAVRAPRIPIRKSVWSHYYEDTNYSQVAFEHKRSIVASMIDSAEPKSVWDLGANVGLFGRIAAERGLETVCFDLDPVAVEIGFRETKKEGVKKLLPLVSDLTNPSPSIGWALNERMSLVERGPADCVLALALVHHLAIGNNVPLNAIADFLADLGRQLVIEFVPKGDSQVDRLLSTRKDIFDDYTQSGLERAFGGRFTIERKEPVRDSKRVIYLMRRRA